jgi:hypothetical protein
MVVKSVQRFLPLGECVVVVCTDLLLLKAAFGRPTDTIVHAYRVQACEKTVGTASRETNLRPARVVRSFQWWFAPELSEANRRPW